MNAPAEVRRLPHGPLLTSRFLAIAAPHSTNEPCHGRVTATAGPVAAVAIHRLPPPTGRSGRRQRVPMLYGTRRGSRPALLPYVCGVTCEFVTRYGALDGREERGEGDSDLRAARPDDVAVRCRCSGDDLPVNVR